LSDANFFAVASVGALVEGWSLVCPRSHVLNLRDAYRSEGFWSFADRAIEVVRGTYGPVVLFEHGGICEDSQTSCGTAHAHLHIVPLETNLAEYVMQRDVSLTWIDCKPQGVSDLSNGNEYLFVMGDAAREGVGRLAILAAGQSQFFRKAIADLLGKPEEFNYKTHPQAEMSLRTAATLRDKAAAIVNNSLAAAA